MKSLTLLFKRMRAAIVSRLAHLRNRHYALIDLLVFALTPALALYLRTEALTALERLASPLLLYTVIALCLRMAAFYGLGIYQRYWRFAGAADFAQLVLAVTLSLCLTIFVSAVLYITGPLYTLPRSLPVLDALLALLFAGGLRISARLTEHLQPIAAPSRVVPEKATERTLIVGAGYTGALLAREIWNNHHIHLQLVGFVDDDPRKRGMKIYGAPVFSSRKRFAHVIAKHSIQRVIIAMPSAPGPVIREIVESCRHLRVAMQTMPGVHELINGNVSINRLRDVQIEDLLRRVPIETDTAAVEQLLRGKRVLVTGSGGSIGSELCRQILRCRPATLILVGHGENSIFAIQQELAEWLAVEARYYPHLPTPTLHAAIADLRFRERLLGIFATHRPQVVFHAAAHKHVPLMEENPVEAITNNVLGTQLLLAAAQAHAVERFVMISSDKAVNPTNVMGASKRVAELLVLQAAQQHRHFYQVVRFGNVLGSRGSVIHTFRRQIAAGGPVTVTHPEMVRYFMTIPEAVQLVLQAAVLGSGAEVLMLDMGEPVRIADLARDLIALSGLQEGRDIEIAYSGVRPGEKLYEEMFNTDEAYRRTQHAKIFLAHNASHVLPCDLDAQVDALTTAALSDQRETVLRLLQELLPEYQPWSPRIDQETGMDEGDNPPFAIVKPKPLTLSPTPIP